MTKSYVDDIERQTEANDDFRHVLFTGQHVQLVVMSLDPGEEIGEEVHDATDQFFRIESGKGEVVIEGVATPIQGGTGIVIAAGTRHNVKNTGPTPLRLYTLYAPPEHAEGTVRHTKADAERAPEHYAR
jgi:mannose-6-phosphate isomerase-like protein (cupin superfamily)